MKIITVVGARPQFVKAAIVSREFAARPQINECIVHTGQHYDQRMSQVFFDELGLPRPTYNLQVGSGNHGQQTGAMLMKIEGILLSESPDVLLVYGDTNSTIAGALAAAKLHIPVCHVEAGLRSYNRQMPEEVNRVLTDHASRLLFCPTESAVENLAAEGIRAGAYFVGDVMYDAAMHFSEVARQRSRLDGLPRGDYILMTCHRAENTDDLTRLEAILAAASEFSQRYKVLLPLHPRTKAKLADFGLSLPASLEVVEPLSYLEMLSALRSAALALTDSGGVQKEAFYFGVPCVTMRPETEWEETVQVGANVLVEADVDAIVAAVELQRQKRGQLPDAGPYYGEGAACRRIADHIEQEFGVHTTDFSDDFSNPRPLTSPH